MLFLNNKSKTWNKHSRLFNWALNKYADSLNPNVFVK